MNTGSLVISSPHRGTGLYYLFFPLLIQSDLPRKCNILGILDCLIVGWTDLKPSILIGALVDINLYIHEPSESIALSSTDYKTVALLLC